MISIKYPKMTNTSSTRFCTLSNSIISPRIRLFRDAIFYFYLWTEWSEAHRKNAEKWQEFLTNRHRREKRGSRAGLTPRAQHEWLSARETSFCQHDETRTPVPLIEVPFLQQRDAKTSLKFHVLREQWPFSAQPPKWLQKMACRYRMSNFLDFFQIRIY